MKKNMTIDDLAALMIMTMASKEDIQTLASKEALQSVKKDVQHLTKRVDDLHINVQKIDNKINRVENYKVMQLELIKLLRDKKVITQTEAHNILTA